MTGEFELISRYFASITPGLPTDALAVGDDAALLPAIGANEQVAVCCDTLVAGVHFFPDDPAAAIGWKALAVNLSDLAAMGAEPMAFLLALTLPQADEAWLTSFADGLSACACAHGVPLVGGDTTRGPLAVTVTALGRVPKGKALRRDAAQPGDRVWVSGTPGAATLGLKVRQGRLSHALSGAAAWLAALQWPQPRLALGQRLRGVAHAAIDVSDGLVQDLAHWRDARPELAIVIEEARLPLAPLIAGGATPAEALEALLYGGDDYELAFTAPEQNPSMLLAWQEALGVALHCIGRVAADGLAPGLWWQSREGVVTSLPKRGWEHFRGAVEGDAFVTTKV